jgi:hypothetical protein
MGNRVHRRTEKISLVSLEKSSGSTIDRAFHPPLATSAIALVRRTQRRPKTYEIRFRCTAATPLCSAPLRFTTNKETYAPRPVGFFAFDSPPSSMPPAIDL